MNKNIKFLLFIFFVSASIISFMGPISGDGCWHVANGKFISATGKLPLSEPLGRDGFFWPPFLFHTVIAAFNTISTFLGLNLIFLILPLAYLGTLIFTYKLSKEWFNERIAFFTVLILGTTPLFLDYATNYFIGVFVTFFTTGAVFFAHKKRVAMSGLFFGLALFSKLIGIFIFPLLVFILYKHKLPIKKYGLFIITSLVGLIPYIRNYIIFNNPVWPFLNNFFNGKYQSASYSLNGLSYNFNIISILKSLGFSIVGIPHGSWDYSIKQVNSLLNFNISALALLVILFEISILLFVLYYGLKGKISKKKMLLIWVLSYIPFQIVYLVNSGAFFARFFLPAYPALAILFGIGINNLLIRHRKHTRLVLSIFLLLIIISTSTVSLKHIIANHNQEHFKEDYNYISNNIANNKIIYYNSQCLTALTGKMSKAFENYNFPPESIIFFNNNYIVEPRASLSLDEQEAIIEATNCRIIYENPKTKTKLCKV